MTAEHQNEEMEFSGQGYEVHQHTYNENLEHGNGDSYGKPRILLYLPYQISLARNIDLSQAQLSFIPASNFVATNDSPESLSSFTDMQDLCTPVLAFSTREALFMRNFIESMALWVSRFLGASHSRTNCTGRRYRSRATL